MADDAGNNNNTTCNFFRKPSKPKNIRKRKSPSPSPSSEEDSETSKTLSNTSKKPSKTPSDNKLHFSSSNSNPSTTTTPKLFQFESSKQIQLHSDNLATATLETETDFSHDSRAIRERVLKNAEKSLKNPSSSESSEKLYKGIHGYTDYKAGFRREQTVAGEKAGGSHGPLRASAHIRVSARFDYQPDICKDYKETGYCGFGDSCKFMHDRGDYKSGWQLEKEWEEREKARKRELAMGGGGDEDGEDVEEEDEEEGLPFACFICREGFQNPVVTKCKHYFCEHCALKHHSTNKKCFVCNKPTLGLFNTAHEILKKIGQQK